ncbi:MAG TPA: M18 family aminopeptidase, partial [Arthrobacter bacterium]|nr:M18 family aminopeptidase [Arthrobacter sp.]
MPSVSNAAAASAVDHIQDLGAYVSASPSSFHAVHEAARRLDAAGFAGLDEREPWAGGPGSFYLVRDGALITWVVPEDAGPTTGFNILGAHTDSPSFKLKPKPTTGAFGWLQAGVEVYGGPLLNSWLDRELQLAGRLVMLDGAQHLTATGPMLRFPQLAIHLDRAVNDGLTLDKQRHMNPVWGLGDPADVDLLAVLASHVPGVPVDPARIGGYDVVIADTQAPAVFGANSEFFASGRLDNLSATHAGLAALIAHGSSAVSGGP